MAGQLPFQSETSCTLPESIRYEMYMNAARLENDIENQTGSPWALQMHAIALSEPDRLLPILTGAIVSCGGWVLSRSTSDRGFVSVLFEFERDACVDIYSGLVGAGLELSRTGHLRFTELCQCTLSQRECGTEIASIELEVQTYPIEPATQGRIAPAA